jgi:hypothetical protein
MTRGKNVEDVSLDDKIGRRTRIKKFRQWLLDNRRETKDPQWMAGLKVIFISFIKIKTSIFISHTTRPLINHLQRSD